MENSSLKSILQKKGCLIIPQSIFDNVYGKFSVDATFVKYPWALNDLDCRKSSDTKRAHILRS